MLKRLLLIVSIIAIFFTKENAIFADNSPFDLSNVNQGMIEVKYELNKNVKTKIMISHNGQNYYYDLLTSDENFPLQMGNGKYTVAICEQKEGKQYVVKNKESFEVNIKNEKEVYLNSNQVISWDDNNAAVELAKKLTEGINDDEEKVRIIHDYIVKNVQYDSEKYSSLDKKYLPNVDDILQSKKGICYDYASLFAVMLRSVDVPTKLVKGYKNDISVYHAWNEVYVNNKWITADCSYDATLYSGNLETKIIKDSSQYKIEKVY
ncbi:transglutaminase-like domain-containing protein [Tepidibacter hydrothermalis]|uniref:Transglutaminase-like domain-containing protein n=1 Tax=Tepidibacter hydrothermalis TaxID=3036126 RepID=A0ABY8EE20_9FIRM|nr:transglutaminase-like domain-containing protein [Tepidibacter hydrothermalis]WFD11193.1 transglutaminase-like domain-containing protein [Tepidibacter hydrothermalis]